MGDSGECAWPAERAASFSMSSEGRLLFGTVLGIVLGTVIVPVRFMPTRGLRERMRAWAICVAQGSVDECASCCMCAVI